MAEFGLKPQEGPKSRYDELIGKWVIVYTSGPTSMGRLEEVVDFDYVTIRPNMRPQKRQNGRPVVCLDTKKMAKIPYHAITTMEETTERYIRDYIRESRNPTNGEKKDG